MTETTTDHHVLAVALRLANLPENKGRTMAALIVEARGLLQHAVSGVAS